MTIRSDLQSLGLYLVCDWLLKAMVTIENEQDIEFASFAEDFVPFLAKNQFKNQIRKMAPLPKKDSIEERIAIIMNPR